MNDVKLGRPKIDPADKKIPNGLTVTQWDRVKEEARKRDMPAAQYLRQIVNWHFIALDEKQIVMQSAFGGNMSGDQVSEDKPKRVKVDKKVPSNVNIKFNNPQNIVKENK